MTEVLLLHLKVCSRHIKRTTFSEQNNIGRIMVKPAIRTVAVEDYMINK